jgi:hypothetical protein
MNRNLMGLSELVLDPSKNELSLQRSPQPMKAKIFTLLSTLSIASICHGEVKVTFERAKDASGDFKFEKVPAPRRGDVGAKATFTLIEGERDRSGGGLEKLRDGRLPRSADEPASNFFFRPGTDGGRILVDLGSAIELKEVNTYSWHGGTRGPQVYKVYGSEGQADGTATQPKRPADPTTAGWKLLATVDTREGEGGGKDGQFGVNIADSTGSLGKLRYLLFDVFRAETADDFGNTFLSEIDVIDKAAPNAPEEPINQSITKSVEIEDGTRFTIETTESPDLTEWAHRDLVPVVQKWYPKLVAMLPSEGFTAPRTFSITFTDEYKGVAATMGNRVVCAPPWYRRQLKGEAIGSVVHELVHVVQQYGRARRAGGNRAPGWLVEGLCDYIRWYLYEPDTKGCEIPPGRAASAKYDASYRVTANFLSFVITKYDKDLIKELNAAMREGRYTPEIWKTRTGKPVEELAEEWKKALAEPAPAAAN